jgi:hypothetical protein
MRFVYLIIVLWSSLSLAQETVETVGELPNDLFETSGLLFYNGKLISHNDSGGTAQLFELDTISREIIRTVTITNVENNDWEALSQDESYIYIGDFGNNVGTRTNLAVYRVLKSDYDSSDMIMAEVISFSYEDQTAFNDNGDSDWDAEAFFILGDECIVLTKQWQSFGSDAYAFPKTPGNYIAQKRDTAIDIGLITDADYNADNETLFLIGYNNFLNPFVIYYSNISSADVFTGVGLKTTLNIGIAQTEGIASDDMGTYYLTSEYFTRNTPNITSSARLFKFDYVLEPEPKPEPEPEPEPENPEVDTSTENEVLILFSDFSSKQLGFKINSDKQLYGMRIYDVYGKLIWSQDDNELIKQDTLNLQLPNAVHYFVVYLSDEIVSKGFLTY